tara:strand:+ start:4247 stop:5125 length:879 start_codon:yes stop_codon:yes gene_type:complete
MIKLSINELSEICNRLGKSKVINIEKIFGGSINNTFRIDFKDSRIFLKKSEREQKLLKFEKYCLNDLKKYVNPDNIIIPKVIHYFEHENNEFLLMEWIDFNNVNQKKLGAGIAELHLNSNKNKPNQFGYSVPGFIGTTNQLEGWESDWFDCFIKLRIEPQISLLKDFSITKNLMNRIKSKIKIHLSEHEPMNSLIHGDLWSGNIGTGYREKGIIFDPSCWWADSEVDIAMTRLFGGFTDDFYSEYYKIVNEKKGSHNRTIIYNFYHILNHANMFGGSYNKQVNAYINMILEM